MAALLGRTPRRGDRVNLGNLQMEVTETGRRRVRKIRLTLVSEGGAPC
jgi:Mg2+/Co2+ transporter CorC